MPEFLVRRPAVAGRFYPGNRTSCIRIIEQCLPSEPSSGLPDEIVAGLVPHLCPTQQYAPLGYVPPGCLWPRPLGHPSGRGRSG
jgi:hypothetical protein